MRLRKSRRFSIGPAWAPSRYAISYAPCPAQDRRIVGSDIATIEFGWPKIGKPTCAPLGAGLWEVRSNRTTNRIARVIFAVDEGHMILLHGFIKKTRKTPKSDLDLARKRMKEVKP